MRTVKNLFIALAVAMLMALPVKPAFAHTEIDITTPDSGESVVGGEQLISVSFTDKILNLANSTEIVVTDSSGTAVKTDCSGVEEQSIYTNAFLATAGEYEVTWRTVAEDGHPISGKFNFTVSEDASVEYTQPSCATDTPTAEPTPKVIATPLAAGAQNDEPKTEGLNPFLTSGFAVLGLAIIAWLIFRKKAKE